MSDSEPQLWARRSRDRHADLYEAEYAKQLERIERIRSTVSARLPGPPPPAPASRGPGLSWDAAPAALARATPNVTPRGAAAAHPPAAAAARRDPEPRAAAGAFRAAGEDPRAAAGAFRAADEAPRGDALATAAPPRPRFGLRRRIAVAALAGLALGGAALVAARPADIPAAHVFRVPGQPTGLVADGGRVWVAGPASGAVWILDASGRPAAPPVVTGGTPARLALGARWAWIADTQRGAVVRVHRAGGRAARPVRVGPDVADVAVAAGAVWTASSADGTLRVLEPDRRVPRVVYRGVRPLALAAGGGRVVAADEGAGALVRLSARSGRPEGPPVLLGGSPVDVALTGTDAWVADADAGTLRRVDLAAGRAGAAIRVGREPVAVAADADAVFVLCRGDRTLVRVDPASGAVRSRLPLAYDPAALALDPRHVWIAAGQNEVIRVDR